MSTKKTENINPKPENNSLISNGINPIWNKVFFFSLIAIFIAMTIMSFSYGISGDEVDMNLYGKAILKYFTSFGSDKSVFATSEDLRKALTYDYNRDNMIQYYGGLFDFLCAIINKISPFDEYTTRHILNAWSGFLAIFFVAKIVIRILNKQAATIAIWLLFLSPFFLGHAMNNPKDIPFAATYIMAIYFIISLFDNLPKPSKLDYLWAILSIGATINVRVGGILLIPYLVVFAGIIFIVKKWFQKEDVSLLSFIKPVLITGALGYFAGSILWPYGLQNPISNPLNALSEMSNFKVNIKQLFEGQKIFSGELPIYFLPKSFIITNTYVVLIGILLMIAFAWSFRKNKNAAILYFVLFTAFFPLAYIIYGKSNVYHGWRHVLFIFPSIMVLVAFGWNQFIEFLNAKKLKVVGLALVGIMSLEPIYYISTTFPNTICYFNAFVGGTKGAYTNYEVDYYYNSLKQSADWFKKNELPKYKSTDTIRISTNAAHILTNYFTENKNVIVDYMRYPERNQKNWDYAIMHIALIPNEDLRAKTWLPSSTLNISSVYNQALCAVIKRNSKEDILGFSYLNQNKIDSALVAFTNYLKTDTNNTSILNTVGNIYLQLQNIPQASMAINKSYLIDSSNMETKQMYGMLKIQTNDFATAQTIFTNLIQQEPQYARGYFYLAMAQMGAGNLQTALQNFNTASQDESIRQACYKFMGDIYMKQGNQAEAAKLYQAAGMK